MYIYIKLWRAARPSREGHFAFRAQRRGYVTKVSPRSLASGDFSARFPRRTRTRALVYTREGAAAAQRSAARSVRAVANGCDLDGPLPSFERDPLAATVIMYLLFLYGRPRALPRLGVRGYSAAVLLENIRSAHRGRGWPRVTTGARVGELSTNETNERVHRFLLRDRI